MKCPKCNAENADDSVFCEECGADLAGREDLNRQDNQTEELRSEAGQSQQTNLSKKKKKRLIIIVLAAVLLIGLGIGLYMKHSDPVEKEIEEEEGQKITVTSKEIESKILKMGSDDAVDGQIYQNETIEYYVIYSYTTEDGSASTYKTRDSLTISVSDASVAEVADYQSVHILKDAQENSKLKVTLKYRDISKEFDYTVLMRDTLMPPVPNFTISSSLSDDQVAQQFIGNLNSMLTICMTHSAYNSFCKDTSKTSWNQWEIDNVTPYVDKAFIDMFGANYVSYPEIKTFYDTMLKAAVYQVDYYFGTVNANTDAVGMESANLSEYEYSLTMNNSTSSNGKIRIESTSASNFYDTVLAKRSTATPETNPEDTKLVFTINIERTGSTVIVKNVVMSYN